MHSARNLWGHLIESGWEVSYRKKWVINTTHALYCALTGLAWFVSGSFPVLQVVN